MDGIMQVCEEVFEGVHVASWCVSEINGKSFHKNCPHHCNLASNIVPVFWNKLVFMVLIIKMLT